MKIYFTSGKTEEIDMGAGEFDRMIAQFKSGGIRFVQLRNGNFVPVNSNTIEMIESELEVKKRRVVQEVIEEPVTVPDENTVVEEKVEGAEERSRKALEEMMEKSACKHPTDCQVLCATEGKKGTRYFHVCSFCGYRSRFIPTDQLSDDDKANAKIFQEG